MVSLNVAIYYMMLLISSMLPKWRLYNVLFTVCVWRIWGLEYHFVVASGEKFTNKSTTPLKSKKTSKIMFLLDRTYDRLKQFWTVVDVNQQPLSIFHWSSFWGSALQKEKNNPESITLLYLCQSVYLSALLSVRLSRSFLSGPGEGVKLNSIQYEVQR